jgi:hypothetical protein
MLCFFSSTFAATGRFKLTDIPPTYVLTLSDGLSSANCLWHAVAATTGSLVLLVVGVLPRGPTRQEGFMSHLSGINLRALHMLSRWVAADCRSRAGSLTPRPLSNTAKHSRPHHK